MNDGERTVAAIKAAEGKRLMYKDPVAEREYIRTREQKENGAQLEHWLPSLPVPLHHLLPDCDRTFPLPRDAAVAALLTHLSRCSRTQFAESSGDNPRL